MQDRATGRGPSARTTRTDVGVLPAIAPAPKPLVETDPADRRLRLICAHGGLITHLSPAEELLVARWTDATTAHQPFQLKDSDRSLAEQVHRKTGIQIPERIDAASYFRGASTAEVRRDQFMSLLKERNLERGAQVQVSGRANAVELIAISFDTGYATIKPANGRQTQVPVWTLRRAGQQLVTEREWRDLRRPVS